MSSQTQIRVLIADDDNQLSRRLATFVSERGFDVRVVTSGKDARAQILEWKPRFVLADLMLPEGHALSLIDFVKGEKALRHQLTHVIVMSGHSGKENVRQAFLKGAKDYIVKPFRHEDVLKRLVFHSRNYRGLSETAAKPDQRKMDSAGVMLHLTDLVLKQALSDVSLDDTLFNLTKMVSLKVEGVRCSIVQGLDQKTGVVVTSSDARDASGIRLDLYKYPEILHVMNTQSLIAIENLEDSLELKHIREKVQDISFNSMIVCPVSRHAQPFGVLSLRMPPEKQALADTEIRFVEIVAQIASLVLGGEKAKDSGDFWLNTRPGGAIPIPFRSSKNS